MKLMNLIKTTRPKERLEVGPVILTYSDSMCALRNMKWWSSEKRDKAARGFGQEIIVWSSNNTLATPASPFIKSNKSINKFINK